MVLSENSSTFIPDDANRGKIRNPFNEKWLGGTILRNKFIKKGKKVLENMSWSNRPRARSDTFILFLMN